VERLGKRSKWRQRREGRPMGPDVYPDPSRREPHMRREAEQRRRCSRAATNAMAPAGGWGHEDGEEDRVQGPHELELVLRGS
jgi:hypothetical protein